MQDGKALLLGAVEHDLTLPLPDWLSPAERLSGNVIDQVVASYRADASQALLEIYPKGESEADWRTLYGARITLQADRPLDDYRSAVMSFHKTAKGSAIVYQEWRGRAFDPSDPKTWPVEANVLQTRAEQLKSGAALALAD